MAIKDISRKPYIEDNDTNIRIGIDLPIRKGNDKDGYFATTSTTIEAVKNNIRNLLNTHQGERLFQPNLGINLRRYLFSQITDETLVSIQDSITSTFSFWLPFVQIQNISLKNGTNANSIIIDILFNIKQDPNTLDSVQVSISNDTNEQSADTSTGGSGGGGGY
jgi:phage baseplate assembly protein W|tara:strand:- start:356 stop:847 length:492 start_codon:yes stop_codon:yes gene_type:complete